MTSTESKSILNVLGVGSSMRQISYSTAALRIILEKVGRNNARLVETMQNQSS